MHLDHSELGCVANYPLGLLYEVFPVSQDSPGHSDTPATVFPLGRLLLIQSQVRVGDIFGRRRTSLGEPLRYFSLYMQCLGSAAYCGANLAFASTLFAGESPTVVVTEEANCDRVVGVPGVDQDGVAPVVSELEVWRAPADGRLNPFGVSAEVVGVGFVGDVLVAAPEDGVVESRGELADSTTDGVNELTGDDGSGWEVSTFFGPLTDVLVETERLAGENKSAPDVVGHLVDIRDTVGTARVKCRERRHHVVDVQTLQILCCDVGVGAFDEGELASPG